MSKNKYILFSLAFFQGLVFYGPFVLLFKLERGLSLSSIFLLDAIFLIIMLCFELPWGIVADKIGYKKTLIISSFLFLLSRIVVYNSYSFLGFFMANIFMGLAISGMSGVDSAMLYLSVKKEESDKVFGIYGAFATIGFFIASLSSSFLVKYSLNFLVFLTIISYGIAFLICLFLKDAETNRELEEKNKNKFSISNFFSFKLLDKKILIFILSLAILSETTHTLVVLLNQPLYKRSGINIALFGILTAFIQIATFIGLKAYKIKEYLGIKKLCYLVLLAITIGSGVLIFTRNPFIVVGMIFIIEGAFALIIPISETIKNDSISSSKRVTILSTYAVIMNVVGTLSKFFIALVAKKSLDSTLLFCLLLNILALGIMGFYFKRSKVKA